MDSYLNYRIFANQRNGFSCQSHFTYSDRLTAADSGRRMVTMGPLITDPAFGIPSSLIALGQGVR